MATGLGDLKKRPIPRPVRADGGAVKIKHEIIPPHRVPDGGLAESKLMDGTIHQENSSTVPKASNLPITGVQDAPGMSIGNFRIDALNASPKPDNNPINNDIELDKREAKTRQQLHKEIGVLSGYAEFKARDHHHRTRDFRGTPSLTPGAGRVRRLFQAIGFAVTLPARLQKLRLPVVAAPLFIISNPDLVIAQCKAGIVGSFPALNAREAPGEPIMLEAWLNRITEELDRHNQANPDHPAAPFAVNQIVYKSNARLERDIEICHRWKVPVWITSLGARPEVNEAAHACGGISLHDIITMSMPARPFFDP